MTVENSVDATAQVTETLKRQVEIFKSKLIDFSRNNRLLFYRDLKIGTLRLPNIDSVAIRKLLAGATCKLGELIVAEDGTTDRAKAREIRLRARANEEERGLKTLFVALGFVSWSLDDGGRDPRAPLFLLPVDVAEANRPGLDPTIQRAGDVQPNYALISYLAAQYNMEVEVEQLIDEENEDLALAISTFERFLQELPRRRVDGDCVLSNFDFQKLAMVQDLENHYQLIADNELIAAMTGDTASRAAIAEAQAEKVTGAQLDGIPASDELFVLDADSSQQQVLHSLLRNQSHGVIQGPPGTGKSQTIANFIAALIGAGKRVLFVAEKRAALDAVIKRLKRVGLGHLILDLHGADVKRRKIYDGLRIADQIARTTPPTDGEMTYTRFEELRRHLNEYSAAVNEVLPQCGMSFYELQGRLAALDREALCEVRLSKSTLVALGVDTYGRQRELVGQAAAFPRLFLRSPKAAWATADFCDDDSASTALELVERMSSELEQIHTSVSMLRKCSDIEDVTSLAELRAFEAEIVRVLEVVEVFESSVATSDVALAAREMQSGQASFISRIFSFLRSDHRRAVCKLREHARRASSSRQLYLAARSFIALALPWQNPEVLGRLNGGEGRALGRTLRGFLQDVDRLKETLRSGELADDLGTIAVLVHVLRSDRLSAYRVAQIRKVEQTLQQAGLSPVLQEFSRKPERAEIWQEVLDGVWLQSHIEQAYVSDARLSTFDRRTHEAAVREFQELDKKRLIIAANRIKRRAAETYFAAKRKHADEDVLFQTQLARKIKQLPLRKLMTQAPRVTTSLCPCWMASPLSVSQLISPTAAFDVVVFDEASQILPEDAITSIIRGKRTIVAGDRHQLPPTTFFSSSEADEEDVDVDVAGGIESILDLMSIFVPAQSLDWHYRSKDERLIAFSNEHIYHNLITFPGIGSPPPAVQHFLVNAVPIEGEEASSSAEVRAVVDLILNHASTRPHESLGVIAMGIKHARRIDAALYESRKSRPELDDFFADRGEETFFCKNLERVQGDERDVIVLSMGYGKDKTGKMYYRFGPLANLGGERRLNVAITRARSRVVLTSTFGSADMDERRLNSAGTRLLKRYLRYAETSGADLGRDQQRPEVESNLFETDIQTALEAKGLSIMPQWGVSSYRIDLAVQHPERPGSFVMAVECDGATYHSAQTARDRDRIRQNHLEALGWKFHRIWSTDWFLNRAGEIDRAVEAYQSALQCNPHPAEVTELEPMSLAGGDIIQRNGKRPATWPGRQIEEYPSSHLRDLIRWIASDGLLRTDDELVREAMAALGYKRLGPRIDSRLRQAIKDAKLSTDR